MGVDAESLLWPGVLSPAEAGRPGIAAAGSPTLALPLLIAVTAWWATPYAMVLFDAALQSLPAELYEAAAVDGARARHTFVHLTLPLD